MTPVAAVIVILLVLTALAGILVLSAKREIAARQAKEVEGDHPAPRKHAHQWRYHSSHFNEPIGSTVKGSGAGIFELHQKLMFGFTNITYTCTVDECTEVRVEEHIGKVSDPYQGMEYKPEAKEAKE